MAQFEIIKQILDFEHLNTYTWWELLTGKGKSKLGTSRGFDFDDSG